LDFKENTEDKKQWKRALQRVAKRHQRPEPDLDNPVGEQIFREFQLVCLSNYGYVKRATTLGIAEQAEEGLYRMMMETFGCQNSEELFGEFTEEMANMGG
jgi:hypothetical protein